METDFLIPHSELKPSDLRGILKYVPQWRNHIFVIAVDGSIIEEDNFPTILIDLAVLRSLNIKIILVTGIGQQLRKLAEQAGRDISWDESRGESATDAEILELAINASSTVSHKWMQGLTQNGLKCVVSNAIRATETGIIKGRDHIYTGKVSKIDDEQLSGLLEKQILPIIPPINFGRNAQPLRINSDLLAAELAVHLKASKLIYLTSHRGLTVRGDFRMNVPVEEVSHLLETDHEAIDGIVRSKAIHSVRAIEAGVPRAHIIDGRIHDGLLTEVFSKVGIGTMIHGNEYQQIRKAGKADIQGINNIVRNGIRHEQLRHRSLAEIEQEIDRFYVYEIDDSLIGCVSLTDLDGGQTVELSAVYVQSFYQNRGVGKKLVEYALLEARKLGFKTIVALSTQSFSFFTQVCEFTEGSVDDLPPKRRQSYLASGRNSKILIRSLS